MQCTLLRAIERDGKRLARWCGFDSALSIRGCCDVAGCIANSVTKTLLVSGLALVLVRWTFMDPLKRMAKWLRTMRLRRNGNSPLPCRKAKFSIS